MAILCSRQSGNWTDANTWGTCFPASGVDGDGTSIQIASGATKSDDSTFVLPAGTYDAVGVKVHRMSNASFTGTFSIILRNVTTGQNVATATVGHAKLLGFQSYAINAGWTFIKFASTATANGTDTYRLHYVNNFSQSIHLFASSLANATKFVRSTTTQAPAGGDFVIVCGNLDNTADENYTTVTMDQEVRVSTANPSAITGAAWTNAGNAQAADGAVATWTTSVNNDSTTLTGTQCLFAIPSTDVVLGLLYEARFFASTTGRFTVSFGSITSGSAHVTESKALTIAATDTPTTYWPIYFNPVWYQFGNQNIAASDVNHANFGMRLTCTHTTTNSDTLSVDFLRVTVYSTPGYAAIDVGTRGILQYATAPNKQYALAVTGWAVQGSSTLGIRVGLQGKFTIGTQATPMPASSMGIVKLQVGSNNAFGAWNKGGIIEFCGEPKTNWTTLSSTLTSGQLSALPVASTSGWQVGDCVYISGTNAASTQNDVAAIRSVDSSTSASVTATWTNTHTVSNTILGRTCPVPVANMTRNVVIMGSTAALSSFVSSNELSTLLSRNVTFYRISSVSINNASTHFSSTIDGCALRDSSNSGGNGFSIPGSSAYAHTISNCVAAGLPSITNIFYVGASTVTHSLTGCCVIGASRSPTGIYFNDLSSTLSNCIAADIGTGITLYENGSATLSNNTAVYCTTCVSSTMFANLTLDNWTIGRGSFGISVSAWSGATSFNLTNTHVFGCSNYQIITGNNTGCTYRFDNVSLYGDTSYVVGYGLQVGTGEIVTATNCVIGGGGAMAHPWGDIAIGGQCRVLLNHCALGSTMEVAHPSYAKDYIIASVNHDQVSGSHVTIKFPGTLRTDTTFWVTASPSLRLTPRVATVKLDSLGWNGGWFAPVAAGQAATISLKIRKSVAFDGAVYDGSQPRVLVKSNYSLGIASDTVLATATNAANGAWETLNGTTAAASQAGVLEFFVDCDGTTGWVNVDDISLAVA